MASQWNISKRLWHSADANAYGWAQLAEFRYFLGDNDGYADCVWRALAIPPITADAATKVCAALARMRRHKDIYARNPDFYRAGINYAGMLEKDGFLEEARPIVERIYADHPQYAFGAASVRVKDIVVEWIALLKGWKPSTVRGDDGRRKFVWEGASDADLSALEALEETGPATLLDVAPMRDALRQALEFVAGKISVEKQKVALLFAATVAEFALILENSKFKGDASFKDVLKRAMAAKGEDAKATARSS